MTYLLLNALLACEAQEERDNLLKEYTQKQAELQKIKDELSQYAQGDPAVYEQKKKDIEAMKESALRWTGEIRPSTLQVSKQYKKLMLWNVVSFADQISSLICYARDTLNVEPAQLVAELELPENYEDLCFP